MARDGENEVEVELPLESYGKRKKTIGQVEAQKQLARATRLFGYFFSTFFFGCHIIFHAIGWFIFIKEHLDDWFYVPYLFIFAIIAIYCFIKASFGDPGFLPCNTANINSNNPPPNICTTCQLVRPMRSKHCKYCGRCVARFDHHCPFINNCVGAKNYPYFIGMVISQMANISIALWEGFPLFARMPRNIMFQGYPKAYFLLFVLISLCFLWLCAFIMVAFGIYRLYYNITTNEFINYRKYNYVNMSPYFNLFDRGAVKNFYRFFSFHDDPPKPLLHPPVFEKKKEDKGHNHSHDKNSSDNNHNHSHSSSNNHNHSHSSMNHHSHDDDGRNGKKM